MARTPAVTRDMVPEQFREAYDRVTSDPLNSVNGGPGSVMLNSPEMRDRANSLVRYFREISDLPMKIQELVMILTARHMDCQYIWYAHSARARKAGLSDELVDSLRDGKPLPDLPTDEDAVVRYATELFTNHRVSQETFQNALDLFGASGLTEISTMMGYYTMLAFNVNAFEVEVPSDGDEPPLPI